MIFPLRSIYGGAPAASIDFSQFFYYPALLCGIGEHLGYRELPAGDKQNTTPILELSHRSSFSNFEIAANEIATTSDGRPFILDLSHEPAPPPTYRASLHTRTNKGSRARRKPRQVKPIAYGSLNPADGFSAWREMVTRFPNANPTIQYTDAHSQTGPILRQAVLLSQGGNCVAIRITQQDGMDICEIIPQIFSILETPDRLLIVVDCGQGRTHISERANFAINTISQIVNNVDLQIDRLFVPYA